MVRTSVHGDKLTMTGSLWEEKVIKYLFERIMVL
jgi:hypothetical protein